MYSITRNIILISAVIIITSLYIQRTNGANILGVFTSHSPSHLIVHMSVMKALAERGHNVTAVSLIKPIVNHEKIHNIIIPMSEYHEKNMKEKMTEMATKKISMISNLAMMLSSNSSIIELQIALLKDPRFTVLYDNPDKKFDLIIAGYFMNDYVLGVAEKFKCPIIINWMGPSNELMDGYVGNPRELSYVPNMMTVSTKVGEIMTFSQRLLNTLSNLFFRGFRACIDYRMEKVYNELFSNEKNFPTYYQMKKNVSMVFVNGHFSEGPIRPYTPGMVEIGGIQIKDKPDPLPKDIENFLEASKQNGAILFSLGSNLQGSNINPETVKIIFNTLSSLKQNVIWKWEDLDKTPGKSSNILYKKWLPQDDILAHPNLRLFITHAGKGGIAEAQYHAVPMIALPVFADQGSNAGILESAGFGIKLDLLTLKEVDLKNAIIEVLTNKTYAQNVKTFSELYRDRPLTAKQAAVFWSEYVIRHHGAAHIQSPVVHMNIIQTFNLDVIAIFLLAFFLIFKLTKLVIKLIFRKIFGKKDLQKKKVKKQ